VAGIAAPAALGADRSSADVPTMDSPGSRSWSQIPEKDYLALSTQMGDLAEALRPNDSFAGVAFDGARLHILSTHLDDDETKRIDEALDKTVRRFFDRRFDQLIIRREVRFTERELWQAAERVGDQIDAISEEFAIEISSVAVDTLGNSLALGVTEVTGRDFAALEAALGGIRVIQHQETFEGPDAFGAPRPGGLWLTIGGLSCSMGIPVRNLAGTRFVTTAGHCGELGQAASTRNAGAYNESGSSVSLGSVAVDGFPGSPGIPAPGSYLDVAFVPSSSSNAVYTNLGTAPLVGHGTPVDGQAACRSSASAAHVPHEASGVSYRQECRLRIVNAFVADTVISNPLVDGSIKSTAKSSYRRYDDETATPSRGGDSGGAMFTWVSPCCGSGVRAIGLHTGSAASVAAVGQPPVLTGYLVRMTSLVSAYGLVVDAWGVSP
jgi:hypothetical protein